MNSESDFAARPGHEAAHDSPGSGSPTASSGSRDSARSWPPSFADTSSLRAADAEQLSGSQCGLDDVDSGRAAVLGAPDSSPSGRNLRRRGARRRGGVPVCLLATAAFLLALVCPAAVAAKQCTRFRGSGCHFTVRHGQKVVYPACVSNCKFQVEKELQCPFYSGGLFVTEEQPECADEFMEVAPRRLPDCSTHCCRVRHSSGSFLPAAPGGAAGHGKRLRFQSAGEAACRYEQYSRAEVLAALQGSKTPGAHPGMDILVLGDSLMRQLYSRLVHMMRGHGRVIDYKMHTHASYSVCQEADAFATAPYNGNRSALQARTDDDYLIDIVPRFFQGGSNVEPGLLCSNRPAAINYAHAPTWADQTATLQRYWPAVTAGRHPVLVLSVGFWEKESHVPQEYLDMLTELAQKVERLFVVGVPTVRVVNDAWRAAYAARNAAMAAWAASAGPRAEFVDFDALARVPKGPAAGADGNWHYQCFLQWPSWRNKKLEGLPANFFRDRVYGHPIEGIVMTEDGHCTDEMNRNIWQLIFNVLLSDKGEPASPDVLEAEAGSSGKGSSSSSAEALPGSEARRMLRRQAI